MRKLDRLASHAWVMVLMLTNCIFPVAYAQDAAWSTSGRLDLDGMANLSGGLQNRAASSALLQWGGSLDTATAGWWPGGKIDFSIMGVRSDGNLPARTGAVQLPSNEWAPNFVRVYQLTEQQKIGNASVRVGVMDFNQYFDASDLPSLLHNSSFGPAANFTNFDAPTFPNPGLGIMGEYHFSDAWQARTGVWQGNPPALSGALHQGALWIGEIERDWMEPGQDSPRSDLKLGIWQHTHNDAAPIGPTTSGGYLVGETRWMVGRQQWGGFVLAGTSPAQANFVTQFLATGFLVTGLLPGRPKDQFSIGLTRVNLHAPQPETALEVVYSWQLTPAVSVQPDMQRFWHPGGSNPNVLVAGVRLHWTL